MFGGRNMRMAMHHQPRMPTGVVQELLSDPDLVVLALLRQCKTRPDPCVNEEKPFFLVMTGQAFQKRSVIFRHSGAGLGVDLIDTRAALYLDPI
jgi:hypothetical protein